MFFINTLLKTCDSVVINKYFYKSVFHDMVSAHYDQFKGAVMTKGKSIILSSILAICCSNAFSSKNHSEDCAFPQHFNIYGPSKTHIMSVAAGKFSDFTVIQTSEHSFDVLDQSECKGDGINSVTLKVGTDNYHYSEITFSDAHTGRIFIVSKAEMNKFSLKEFKTLSKYDFNLTYQQS